MLLLQGGITNDNIQERQRAKLNEVNWQINAPGELNSLIQITPLFWRLRTRRKRHVCIVSRHRSKISTAIQSRYLFWPNIPLASMHSFLNTGKHSEFHLEPEVCSCGRWKSYAFSAVAKIIYNSNWRKLYWSYKKVNCCDGFGFITDIIYCNFYLFVLILIIVASKHSQLNQTNEISNRDHTNWWYQNSYCLR